MSVGVSLALTSARTLCSMRLADKSSAMWHARKMNANIVQATANRPTIVLRRVSICRIPSPISPEVHSDRLWAALGLSC
jgi:hypothetical protein